MTAALPEPHIYDPLVEGSLIEPEDADVGVTIVALEDGQTATLRPVASVRNRERRRVLRGIKDPQALMAAGLDMQDALVAVLVSAWSLKRADGSPLPIPAESMESLDVLSIKDAMTLESACAPAMSALFPDFAPKPSSVDPDAPGSASAV